jgi:endonuclease/exonuclease/phosphatase family metal-dependent hydrolase
LELKIVTYNARKNIGAVEYLLSAYKDKDAILVIQEFPVGFDVRSSAAWKFKFSLDLSAKCVFASSPSITIYKEHDEPKAMGCANRFSVYSLRRMDGKYTEEILRVIGVHGYDLRNYQTGNISRLARILKVSDLIKAYSTVNTILAGDFNTDPYSEEMATEFGIMARYDDHDLFPDIKGFTNPMWKFLVNQGFGTYFIRKSEKSRSWRILDQIVYAKGIRESFDPRVDILTKLGDTPLLKKKNDELKSNIPDDMISDHLPVELTITIGDKS